MEAKREVLLNNITTTVKSAWDILPTEQKDFYKGEFGIEAFIESTLRIFYVDETILQEEFAYITQRFKELLKNYYNSEWLMHLNIKIRGDLVLCDKIVDGCAKEVQKYLETWLVDEPLIQKISVEATLYEEI